MGIALCPIDLRPTLEPNSIEGTSECGDLGMLFAGLLHGKPLSLLPAGKLCSVVDRVREQLMRLRDVGHEAWVGDNIVERSLKVLHAILVPRKVSSSSWIVAVAVPDGMGMTNELMRAVGIDEEKLTCTLLQSMSDGLPIASSIPA